MNKEEQYHIDWLASKDNLLSSESLVLLNAFIKENFTKDKGFKW